MRLSGTCRLACTRLATVSRTLGWYLAFWGAICRAVRRDVRTMQTSTAAIAYHPDGSWARLFEGIVTQGGARKLWDDVESTHRRWVEAGRPSRDRYRLAITRQSQQVLLDDSPAVVHELHPLRRSG